MFPASGQPTSGIESLLSSTQTLCKVVIAISVIAILGAGLYPKDLSLGDNAVLEETAGLRFSKYSLAASEPFLRPESADQLNATGLLIDLELEPPSDWNDLFMVIAAVTNGDDATQFLIGQWRTTLIVMSGDDYANRAREPRLYIDTTTLPADLWKLQFALGPNGSQASSEGKVVSRNGDYIPVLPSAGQQAFLTLGNTPDRRHGWQGTIRRLAIRSLSSSESRTSFDFTRSPIVHSANAAFAGSDVSILPITVIKKPNWFGTSGEYFANGLASIRDIVINTVGFVPLSFALCGFLLLRSNTALVAFSITVIVGLTMSLCIEFVQGLLPSRDSTLFDVLFNTAGAVLGAFMALAIFFTSLWFKNRAVKSSGVTATPNSKSIEGDHLAGLTEDATSGAGNHVPLAGKYKKPE